MMFFNNILIRTAIPINNISRIATRTHPREFNKVFISPLSTSSYSCLRKYRKNNIANRVKNEKFVRYVIQLNSRERRHVNSFILKVNKGDKRKNNITKLTEVNNGTLYRVFMINCIPFIAFGILDNMLMILAGEYIDMTLGVALGISTMAAAALGNLISDIVGVGCSSYVEALCCKLGLEPPHLTPAQMMLYKIRYSVATGRIIGLVIGCLLGMFPLLFYENKDRKNEKQNTTDSSD